MTHAHTSSSSPSRSPRVIAILSATALAFGLAACDRNDGQTVGQKIDSTIERTGEAASDAQRRMEAAAAEASQASRQAAARAAEVMDDAGISAKVKAGLAEDAELSAIRIDVDTRNGIVTPERPGQERRGARARDPHRPGREGRELGGEPADGHPGHDGLKRGRSPAEAGGDTIAA